MPYGDARRHAGAAANRTAPRFLGPGRGGTAHGGRHRGEAAETDERDTEHDGAVQVRPEDEERQGQEHTPEGLRLSEARSQRSATKSGTASVCERICSAQGARGRHMAAAS